MRENERDKTLLSFQHLFLSLFLFFSFKTIFRRPTWEKSRFLFRKAFTTYPSAIDKAPEECMEMKVTLWEKYDNEACGWKLFGRINDIKSHSTLRVGPLNFTELGRSFSNPIRNKYLDCATKYIGICRIRELSFTVFLATVENVICCYWLFLPELWFNIFNSNQYFIPINSYSMNMIFKNHLYFSCIFILS